LRLLELEEEGKSLPFSISLGGCLDLMVVAMGSRTMGRYFAKKGLVAGMDTQIWEGKKS
jgi:hypothetical protein